MYCTQQQFADCHPPFTHSNDCYQRNPNAGLRLTFSWLILEIWSYGNVPMGRGIISCFRRKTWFDLVLQVRVQFFEKTQISSLLARCNVPSCAMWQKACIFWRKAFIFWRKALMFWRRAFIFWRLPLWRYGGLDSANSANKVG